MPEIKLKTDGKLISSFDRSQIVENLYSMDNFAILEFTDKNTADLKSAKKLFLKNQPAEVLIDRETRLKGYISKVRPYYRVEPSGVTPCLQVKISTPAARYVNNSIGRGQTFKSQSVAGILAALCPDLQLDIRTDRILPKFVVYGYEDYDEAVSRLCAKSNLLVYSGNAGQLIVDEILADKRKIGYFRTGENVISIERLETEAEGVTISGQLPLDDTTSLNAAISSVLTEPGEKVRFVYGDDVSQASLAAAKSKNKRVRLRTPNWFDADNRLLSLNNWAGVVDAWLDLDDGMLINSLIFNQDKGGFSADLELEC